MQFIYLILKFPGGPPLMQALDTDDENEFRQNVREHPILKRGNGKSS